jgi:4-amino-4-deoxy-L-arabinose transferase-like glycosyltransferase
VKEKNPIDKSYDTSSFLNENAGRLCWVFILIVILVTVALRIRLLDVPLERDEGEYAYVGQLMLDGIPPYLQTYSMKMPGVYAAYALVLAIFGQTQTAVHIGLLIANAVTTLLIFLMVRYLIGSLAGVFAAAAFAIMSLNISVQGIFANAEHFVLPFAIAGIFLLLIAIDRNHLLLLLAGVLLLGIAFLMKQHAIAFIAFAAIYLLLSQLRQKPFVLKNLLIKTGLFVIGVILPFAITCLILWRAGVFEKFWFWTFVYTREYVSIMPLSRGLVTLDSRLTDIAGSAVLIWTLAAAGLVTLILDGEIKSRPAFIAGFLLFSVFSICPGFHFRKHYFLLLLPAVALLSTLGLYGIRQAVKCDERDLKKQLIIGFLALAILAFSLYQQKDVLLTEDSNSLSRMTYGLNPFPESLKIAEYIKTNSSEDDTIAILGSEPQIFFYSNRRSATSYIYTYPLMEVQPFALEMQKEMIEQIKKAQPKFIVYVKIKTSWLVEPTSNKFIFDWFDSYCPQYYKIVGVIDFVSQNDVLYHWDQDAANHHSTSSFGITVFERER